MSKRKHPGFSRPANKVNQKEIALAKTLNTEIIERRALRHQFNQQTQTQLILSSRTQTDSIKCKRLYILPGLPSIDADYKLRNGELRVDEKDGLKLY